MPNTQAFEKAYASLNEAQKKAVDTLIGPVMVVAGPGTGKTQLLAVRVANLLHTGTAEPQNILLTTFTEAGAAAIKNRLLSLIGTDAHQITITTIHAFCDEIIRAYPEKFHDKKALRAMDDSERMEILEDILRHGSYRHIIADTDPILHIRDIGSCISELKSEYISPSDLDVLIARQAKESTLRLEAVKNKTTKTFANETAKAEKMTERLTELRSVYEIYLKKCSELGVYDYVDMIRYALDVMQNDEEVLYDLAERYQYVMIDEYQDSNSLQNAVFETLLGASDEHNVLVVGDDDQSIYRFQGANVENMFRFKKVYGEAVFVTLTQNYRSHKAILDAASALIENNESRICNLFPEIVKDLSAA